MDIAQSEALQLWSDSACQALQEFCDDAQVASGNPDGEDQLLDIRDLLNDHVKISKDIENA